MKKLLLAIGSSAAEDRLKNNQELASEFNFTNIATHRDSILQIARKEKPDVILIKETLGGNADILNIVFSLRSEVPNARIVFMTGPKNPGDSLMNSLVSCGVYDILMASTFSITSIINAIKNPKTFGDVSQFIISTDMQKIMTPQVEQEYVAPAKDRFNSHTSFQTRKEHNGEKGPQEFGYLKIDDGQGKINQEYSPILAVNKGTAGKSFKPMTSKPDISQIEEIVFDDEDELLFDDTNESVQKQETVKPVIKEPEKTVVKPVKPVVEEKKESVKIKPTISKVVDVMMEEKTEEILSYTPPTGNNSFIKNNRQFKDEPLKNNDLKVVEPKVEIKEIHKVEDVKPVEEITFNKTDNKPEEKVVKEEPKIEKPIVKDVVKEEPKKEILPVEEIKFEKKKEEKPVKVEKVKEIKPEVVPVKKEEPEKKFEIKVNDGNVRVYSFIKYHEFTENHASLNIALALAQTNKVLFLMVKDSKRNVIEKFIDSVDETTWYNPYKNNLEFKKVAKYELLNLLENKSKYNYVIIDCYYDKEFCGLLNNVSNQMVHVALQQRPLFDFIYTTDCRKDIAAMMNYKNELLSAKTVTREGMFKAVIKVADTDVEDFNAVNSKVPSMGRKNNAKTLKDYESLLIALGEDK